MLPWCGNLHKSRKDVGVIGQIAKAFPKTSSVLLVLFSLGGPSCITPSMQTSRFEREEGERDSPVDQHPPFCQSKNCPCSMLITLTVTFHNLESLSLSQCVRNCKCCAAVSQFCQEDTQIWPVKKRATEHLLYSQILLPKMQLPAHFDF